MCVFFRAVVAANVKPKVSTYNSLALLRFCRSGLQKYIFYDMHLLTRGSCVMFAVAVCVYVYVCARAQKCPFDVCKNIQMSRFVMCHIARSPGLWVESNYWCRCLDLHFWLTRLDFVWCARFIFSNIIFDGSHWLRSNVSKRESLKVMWNAFVWLKI
jgi:hypothetical protein